MTGILQTDLGPPPAAKYKEEPAEESVSIFLCNGLDSFKDYPVALQWSLAKNAIWSKIFFPEPHSIVIANLISFASC
ncbi:hypothetical protein PHISCL_08901 [Aspergillus sclerotialis]|uniref:Uncharacterized protein n=1 Tax=Aspergillus sclerotialis TaxID=2070753 RepID=A0A3A2Z6M8_9EURO|nr:hypothetical protein PHISCL_08901 [Aspergillus sclerotialis]